MQARESKLHELLMVARLISDLENIIIEYARANAELLERLAEYDESFNMIMADGERKYRCKLVIKTFDFNGVSSKGVWILIPKHPHIKISLRDHMDNCIYQSIISHNDLFEMMFRYPMNTFNPKFYIESRDDKYSACSINMYRAKLCGDMAEAMLQEFIADLVW